MKRSIIVASLILLMLVSVMALLPEGNPDVNEGIQFQFGTWNEVLELARKEDKLIFLDVYASWCGPCKMLKANTFPNAKVGEFYNANFINFAVDAEKGEGIKLASIYNVTAYPTLLFVDGTGKLVAKTMGYHNADKLLEAGQKIQNIH